MNAERGFKLHPGAASDITSIWEFIAKDNLLAAKRVREDILDAIRRLVPFLHQGHQRRELTSRPVRRILPAKNSRKLPQKLPPT